MLIKSGRFLAAWCGLLLALSAAGAAEKTAGPPGAEKGPKEQARNVQAKAQEAAPANGEAARPPQDPIQITSGPEGVSLFAVSADAHELFTRLARETGFKIIVDDTIRRNITVNLVNKKVSEILDHIVGAYGFSSRQVNGIFMVSEGIPKSPSSYLLSDIDAISTQYVLAPNAKSLLPIFLQDHVKTNQEQNSVILSAPPEVLKKFRQDISQFDIPASQILMEVLMVEFSDAGFKEFGLKFNWSNARREVSVDAPLGEIIYHTLVTLPTQFSADMRALIQTGKARIRANPTARGTELLQKVFGAVAKKTN